MGDIDQWNSFNGDQRNGSFLVMLLHRSWRFAHSDNDKDPSVFRVASYNVLAQCYIRSEQFPYCPRGALRSRRRIPKLLNEIESIGADLLCLQEVDFYETALERFLSNNGYVSVFRKRPGKKVDGCCIAVRGSRFELLSCVDWCYDSLADRFGGQSRIVRHNIGMAVGLRDTCSGVCFVLSTTHMLWDPLDADVKVLQAAEMVARTAEFAQCLGTPFMILAGDFNSTPESHAMKLLFDGAIRVPAMTECAAEATANTVTVSDSSKDRFPGNDMEREPPLARESLISEGSSLELPSNLSFCSAYAAANPEGLDIDWTNRRPHFTATIDYILFPSSTMEVRRVLWSPEGPLDEFYLPNADFPSDHIPTVAEMCFKRPE